MTNWRIRKDRPEWSVVPERPWGVYEWCPDGACWGKRRCFATWTEAIGWLTEAWPVLEPDRAA
ncbi:hypothetical protein [Actinomadura sp. SCN-SB]|uniref:hypothetical protein n=1 Tax=Actinomadura sp. SCN-SB TaxID=3373092 RepID=UPI003750E3CD